MLCILLFYNKLYWFLGSYTYQYPSLVPLGDESHGGEDVAVYARGPWAHLFSSSFEQSYIPFAMAFAANIGPGALRNITSTTSTSSNL